MGFQISPGVNITEKDLTNIVPAVATTSAGIAGYFNWGPCEERRLIAGEADLVTTFGKPTVGDDAAPTEYFFTGANFLGYANNLSVVRKVSDNAYNAAAVANTDRGDSETVSNVDLQIKNSDHYWDTILGTTGPGAADEGISGSGEWYYWAAKWPGTLGNSLKVSMSDTHSVSFTDAITGASAGASSLKLQGGGLLGEVAVGDVFSLGNGSYTVTGFSGGASASHQEENDDDTTHIHITPVVNALDTNLGATSDATVTWAYAGNFDRTPSTSTDAEAATATDDEIDIVVVDEDGLFSGTRGTVLERFTASKAKDAKKFDGTSNYYVNVINNSSNYIWWGDHPDTIGVSGGVSGATAGDGREWGSLLSNIESEITVGQGSGKNFEKLTRNFYASMTGGSNGTYSNDSLYLNGYDNFADAETVDCALLLGGPAEATLAGQLIDLCDARKDCVAFLSPLRADAVGQSSAGVATTDIVDYYNITLNKSSSYGVFDGGWKYMYDNYNDVYRWVPLNGDVAGLVARTEFTNDAWWSPAGFNRGQIRGVVRLPYNPKQAHRDTLYKNNVNPVVSFPGEGTVLYGDKTMQRKPSAFDRINVRRLFIVLEKAIATAAKYKLFEFNDAFTRASFVNMVTPFLRDIQGRKGIFDFKVVCDETNNPGSVIDRNEFVADIYVKPARSINFIQLNFIAVGTGVDFNEVAGA